MLPGIPKRTPRRQVPESIATRLEQCTRTNAQQIRIRPLVQQVAGAGTTLVAPKMAELIDRRGNVLAMVACDAEVGQIIIGRGAGCHVHLTDETVSERHAALTWDADAGAHMLTDLGSTNGTRLNHRRIQGRVMVLPGVRLRFGRIEVRYAVRTA
jgi:hypothetical protein